MSASAGRARSQPAFPLLVVSSDTRDYTSLKGILRSDCRLHKASRLEEARAIIRRIRPWVVICDQHLADGDWRDLLTDLQAEMRAPPLIVASRLADESLWAEVLNLGGYDLLMKPFVAMEVSRVVKIASSRQSGTGGAVHD